jgi:hypothetical protein
VLSSTAGGEIELRGGEVEHGRRSAAADRGGETRWWVGAATTGVWRGRAGEAESGHVVQCGRRRDRALQRPGGRRVRDRFHTSGGRDPLIASGKHAPFPCTAA